MGWQIASRKLDNLLSSTDREAKHVSALLIDD